VSAAAQRLLGRYLLEEEFEAMVRARPADVAAVEGVDETFVRWLAELDPRRVRAFRASRQHKDARRRGER
jgi:hypothetical protein